MKRKAAYRSSCSAIVLAMGAIAASADAQDVPAPVPPAAANPATPTVQSQSDKQTGLADIVVTANRRAENLQKVGISVTAFSGDQLQKLGFTNSVELIKLTPAVNIVSSSASVTNINIRGISQNDFADHLEGPIAIYADDGYIGIAGAVNGQNYDLERVEVLRGPQGTLFGRNATGGLVQYISKAPPSTFQAYGQVDVGNYEFAQFEGAVGGPLATGVRARLSVAGTHRDGYVRNTIGVNPDRKNNISARLQVAFDLSPVTELRLMANGRTDGKETGYPAQAVPLVADANGQGRQIGPNEIGMWPNIVLGGTVTGSCPGCNIIGDRASSDVFTQRQSDAGTFREDLGHAQARLKTKLGDSVNLTSVSDYLYYQKDLTDTDTDGGPSQFFRYGTSDRYHQFSQELRLDGEIGDLKWLAGGYYLRVRGDYVATVAFDVSRYVGAPVCGETPNFPCPTPIPGVVGISRADYSIDVDSWSGFAQLQYKVSPRLSLTGGLRYTNDDKTADYVWTTTAIPNFPVTRYNPSTDPSAHRTFGMWSAKLGVDWQVSPGTLAYGSFSRGTKGGNWAMPVFPPPITAANFPAFPHKSEVLNDYELGLKTEFWDRKARVNVSLFYYDYKNYQAFSLAGLVQSIFNKDAKAWGGEAELVLAPTRGLQVSLGASSLTSRIYDMHYTTGGRYTSELPFSAKFSLNGLLRYEWDAFGGKVATQTSFTTVGPHYFDAANEPIAREGRYFTADARLSYATADGHWTGALWVKNLNDERYRQFALDLSVLSLSSQNYAAPRTYGATLGWRY